MNYESNLTAEQKDITSGEPAEYHGKIVLSGEEQAYLKQVILEHFESHPSLKGVEIQKLEIDNVPSAIQEKIHQIGGRITVFLAVKIQKEVPLHQHTTDGEIYFGGQGGIVTLLNESKQEIGKFNLGDENFTLATIGEWHSVTSQNEKGTMFFGVKFTTKS